MLNLNFIILILQVIGGGEGIDMPQPAKPLPVFETWDMYFEIMDKFAKKVNKTDNGWFWLGKPLIRNGKPTYGAFSWKGKSYPAHRFSWYLRHRIDPGPDMLVLHIPGVAQGKLDVDPDHLKLGTNYDNMQDRKLEGIPCGFPPNKGETNPMYGVLGEAHHNCTLSWETIQQMRADWETGKYKYYRELAAKYNCDRSYANAIILKRVRKTE